jgi:hypothetical protein
VELFELKLDSPLQYVTGSYILPLNNAEENKHSPLKNATEIQLNDFATISPLHDAVKSLRCIIQQAIQSLCCFMQGGVKSLRCIIQQAIQSPCCIMRGGVKYLCCIMQQGVKIKILGKISPPHNAAGSQISLLHDAAEGQISPLHLEALSQTWQPRVRSNKLTL